MWYVYGLKLFHLSQSCRSPIPPPFSRMTSIKSQADGIVSSVDVGLMFMRAAQ